MKRLAVVALGGNALIHDQQKGTAADQEQNVFETSLHLAHWIEQDYALVIGHGNGPQVGNIMLSNTAGSEFFGIPDMPLHVDVAYSQGFIGFIIEEQLRNALGSLGINREILTLVTQVIVDRSDPAFNDPTKPIGPYYTKSQAEQMSKDFGAQFSPDPRGRGWRRVVPSPKPLKVLNAAIIEELARAGHIVIAAGGGGIPVYYESPKRLQGIDAVIDKDLALCLLAREIHADEFIILTDVPKVCLNFNTPQQKTLDRITVSEARRYLDEGQFAKGSMAPKILAAVQFIENGGRESWIMDATQIGVEGSGTCIVPSDV